MSNLRYFAASLIGVVLLASLAFAPLQFKDNAFLTNLKGRLAIYQESLPAEKAYLQFDRTLYEPGETIWFKAWLSDAQNHTPSKASQVAYAELVDPKGNVSATLKMVALEGTAKGSFTIGENAPGGLYKVRAYTTWARSSGQKYLFEKTITVQAVTLPNLRMNLDFAREAYGPGDKVLAELKLEDLANRPLKNHEFNYLVQLQGKTILQASGNTDSKGKSDVQFELPKDLASSDGLLNVQIPYQGLTESISRSVPIVLNNIQLQYFPEGGDLVAGVRSRVAFKAVDEFGEPADVSGQVLGKSGKVVAEFSSFHQGMGAFELTPKPGVSYQVKLTQPVNKMLRELLPAAKPQGYTLTTKTFENRVNVTVHNPGKEPVSILAQMRGATQFSSEIPGKEGTTGFDISTNNMPSGVLQITLFDHLGNPHCERLVFANPSKQLNIKVSTDKEKYLPREKVTLDLEVTDDQGAPTPANLTLAVVDDKLLSFTDDKSDNLLSYLLLSSEVKGTIKEPNFYFDPEEEKAVQALDYLLMTQGWRRFKWENWQEQTVQDWLKAASERELETAVVKGTVKKVYGNEGISNITVTVVETGEQTQTDSNGHFQFKNLDLSHPRLLEARTSEGRKYNLHVGSYSVNHILGGRLQGTVKDAESGEPVPFARVYFAGTNLGTTTNVDGLYAFPEGAQPGKELTIQAIGYKNQRQALNGQNQHTIALEQADIELQEVAVFAKRERLLFAPQAEFDAVQVMPAAAPAVQQVQNAPAVKEPKMKAPPPPAPQRQVVEAVAEEAAPIEMEVAFNEDVADFAFGDLADGAIEAKAEADRFPYVFHWQVGTMPAHKKGEEGLAKEIQSRLEYPAAAKEAGIEGKVFVQFTVLDNGQISNPVVLRGVGGGLDEAAVNAIRQLDDFIPGENNGKPVAVKMIAPIVFKDPHKIEIVMDPVKASTYQVATEYHTPREFYAPIYSENKQTATRNDFRKTLYWNPEVKVGSNGKASLTFYTNDAISTFRATVEGLSAQGQAGRAERTYFAQLPLSASLRLPPYLTFEDQISLPITVQNNSDKALNGTIEVAAPEAFVAANGTNLAISMAAKESKTFYMDFDIRGPAGPTSLTVKVSGKNLEDEQTRAVTILPKGFPANASFSSDQLSVERQLEVRNRIEGSMTASVTVYPTMINEIMDGVASLLREPGGCFEQTSRSAYPNILALNYLNATNSASPEVRKKAEGMVERGYERLISFETAEKGYEWFGGVPAHEGLTAYGLMEFVDMKNVYASVDDDMIARTTNWMAKRKDGKGGFKRNSKALDSFGRASDQVTNAYVVYALSEAGYKDLELELNQADEEAHQTKDAYRLACVANAWYNLGIPAKGNKALQAALTKGADTDFANLTTDHSITRSTGQNLEVETVSLMILGMLQSPKDFQMPLRSAVQHLMGLRSHGGRFGSTQGTILALKALTQFAEYNKRTAESGKIVVWVDGEKVATHRYEAGTKGPIEIKGLEEHLAPGKHTVKVNFAETKTALPTTFNANWNTRLPNNQKGCVLDLKTQLNSNKTTMGETVRLSVELANTTSEGQPMVVAKLGIPSGLSLQPWQLKELMEKQVVDFYEIHQEYLVLYYRDMAPNEKHTIQLDLKAEVPGRYEAPAGAAYLYYTDELKTWVPGTAILIRSPQ
ncbi:MAG: TonB family protein [Salibacteraceae bacterium]